MDNNLKLIYIHSFGQTWDNVFVYQFLFTEEKNFDSVEGIDGENWDSMPANSLPTPPPDKHIKVIGELRSGYIFDLLQNSSNHCMWDGIDRVIPLAIENLEDYDEYPEKRLFFRFGDSKKEVDEMLLNNDLILKYTNND
jgi:hypothetical protein